MSDEKSERFSNVPKGIRAAFKKKFKSIQRGSLPMNRLVRTINKMKELEGAEVPASDDFTSMKDYQEYIQDDTRIPVFDYTKAHKEHLEKKKALQKSRVWAPLTRSTAPSSPKTTAPARIEEHQPAEDTIVDGAFDFMLDGLDDEISAEDTIIQDSSTLRVEEDDGASQTAQEGASEPEEASFDFMLDGLEDSEEEPPPQPPQEQPAAPETPDSGGAQAPYRRLSEALKKLKADFEAYKSELGSSELVDRFEAEGIAQVNDLQSEIFAYESWSEERQQNWKESQFLFVLDKLSQFYSYVCKLSFEGDSAAGRIRNELQTLLYGDLNQVCIDLDWFQIEPLVPYRSFFSAEQQTIDSQPVSEDLKNIILSVEHVGLFDAKGSQQLRIAQVVVGI